MGSLEEEKQLPPDRLQEQSRRQRRNSDVDMPQARPVNHHLLLSTIIEDFDDLRIYSTGKKNRDDSDLVGMRLAPIMDLRAQFAEAKGKSYPMKFTDIPYRRVTS